jgi:hypothetical protein
MTITATIPKQRTTVPNLADHSLPTGGFKPGKLLPTWASFTSDGDALAVLVHPGTKWNIVEKALAYGLFHAADHRRLALVLPAASKGHDAVQATRIRAAFLDRTIDIFSYAGADVRRWNAMHEDEAFDLMREATIGGDSWELTATDDERVHALATWADAQPGLVRVHLKHYLAWHCAGRQLLKIQGGKKATVISAGVDYSKPDLAAGQQSPIAMLLATQITPEQLAVVQVRVLQGMLDRVCNFKDEPTDNTHAEHRLQAAMAGAGSVLGWHDARDPHREFPVRRPGGGRGFIDLLRLDPAGVLHIIETKIGHDEMLVLQGLDYWIWAEANREALVAEMGGPIHSTVINYVVGLPGGRRYKQSDKLLSPYAEQHLGELRDDIVAHVEVIEGWQPRAVTLTIRDPKSVRAR